MKPLSIYIFLGIFLVGCAVPRKRSIEIKTVSRESTEIGKLPPDLYLANRVNNCDSTIVYMTKIISPIKVYIHRYEFNEIMVYIRIPGETQSMFASKPDKNRKRFYFAPSCLVGMKLEDVLKIFCTKDDQKRVLEYNNKRMNSLKDSSWYLYVNYIFFLEIKSGKATKSDFMESDIEE